MIEKTVTLDLNKFKFYTRIAAREIIFEDDKHPESKPEIFKILKAMATPKDVSSLRNMYMDDGYYFDSIFNAMINELNVDEIKIYKGLDAYKDIYNEIKSFANTVKNVIEPIRNKFNEFNKLVNRMVFVPEEWADYKFSERQIIQGEHIGNKRSLEQFIFDYLKFGNYDSKVELKFTSNLPNKQPLLYINGSKHIAAVNPEIVIKAMQKDISNNKTEWYTGNVDKNNGFSYATTYLYKALAEHGYICEESRRLIFNIIGVIQLEFVSTDDKIYKEIANMTSKELGTIYSTVLDALKIETYSVNGTKKQTINEISTKLAAYSTYHSGELLTTSTKFIELYKNYSDSYRAYIYSLNSYITGVIAILNDTIKRLSVELPKRIFAEAYGTVVAE